MMMRTIKRIARLVLPQAVCVRNVLPRALCIKSLRPQAGNAVLVDSKV